MSDNEVEEINSIGVANRVNGWVYEEYLLDRQDMRYFYEQVANIHKNHHHAFRSTQGEVVIDVNYDLVFADDSYRYPYITRIVRFNTTNKEEIEVARSIVLQNETGGSISTNEDALAVAENYLREGFVTEYRAEDYSTYARKNRGRKGANSKQTPRRGESWLVGRDGVEETTPFSNAKKYSAKTAGQLDQEYADAEKRGDTETAERMVREAAERRGFTEEAYHGTPFGVFN